MESGICEGSIGDQISAIAGYLEILFNHLLAAPTARQDLSCMHNVEHSLKKKHHERIQNVCVALLPHESVDKYFDLGEFDDAIGGAHHD